MTDARAPTPVDAPPRMELRGGIVACLAWVFLCLVWGAQPTTAAIIRGVAPVPLRTPIRTAFIQTLPWIPVPPAALVLTRRFPLSRAEWKWHLPVHIGAAAVLAFVANMLVVAGYWITAG